MRKATISVIILILICSLSVSALPVDECGVLDQAVEGCITFKVIDGNLYEIGLPSNLSGYGPGDTVRIIGDYIPGLSVCMSGGLSYLYADTAMLCTAHSSTYLPMSSTETTAIICIALLVIGIMATRRFRAANRVDG